MWNTNIEEASPVRISKKEYEETKSKFKNNIRNGQIINSKKEKSYYDTRRIYRKIHTIC